MKPILEILSSPLALLPSTATALLEQYRADVAGGAPPARVMGEATSPNVSRPYELTGSVAVIRVSGVLVHERSFWWSERTYDDIRNEVSIAINDSEAHGIALLVDSPGGVVSGCFDLADDIYSVRNIKPIWAIVDESAFSAAYAIACAAEKIVVPRTGGVGSVGVISMHIDVTRMLEEAGIKVTTIQFGDRKSDSYPTTPLSKEALKRMQSDVDTLGEMFVDLVARNRGMAASTIRETEAGCYLGEAGVNIGLADAVMPVTQALTEFMELVK